MTADNWINATTRAATPTVVQSGASFSFRASMQGCLKARAWLH